MKKFITLALIVFVCFSLVCVPDADARRRRGLKVGSPQWYFFWNMFWLANWRKWIEIPGYTNPTYQVTGTVLPFSTPPATPVATTPFVPPSPAGATTLTFNNASGTDVYLCVSTQSGALPCTAGSVMQDGCPYTVSQLGILDLGTNQSASFVQWPSSAPTNGWYLWKNGHTLQVYNNTTNPYTGKNNGCLQGLIFGVNVWGANCACNFTTPGVPVPAGSKMCNGFPNTDPTSPTYNSDTPASYTLLPNGSSAFEPTLNLPGLQCNQPYGNNPHESVDITCVNGSNAIFQVTITPPSGGPYFTYNVGNGNQTATSSITTQNSWVIVNPVAPPQPLPQPPRSSCDDNCIDQGNPPFSRAGVFPYGATVCTTNPDPNAPCNTTADPYANYKQFCGAAAGSGCNFDRQPASGQVFGGTVAVTYIGPATPPPFCP